MIMIIMIPPNVIINASLTVVTPMATASSFGRGFAPVNNNDNNNDDDYQ